MQRRLGGQRVDQFEAGLRSERHADGDRTIQLHHRRGHERSERVVERDDALPVGLLVRWRARMRCGDGRLQCIRPERSAEPLGALERGQAPPDEQVVPATAILVEQPHRFARRTTPRAQARRLDLHERHQPVHFRFGGGEFGEDAAETERVLAQGGTRPIVAGGCRVALVEDEIDHLQHGGQAHGAFGSRRQLERHSSFRERAFRAHDALGHGRERGEKRARDFLGRQAAHQPQRECDP